jgi:hypothetical protein
VLDQLYLRKYDGCLRSFHALFFIYKLTTGSAVSSILRATDENDLTGQIPIGLETVSSCFLGESNAFSSLPFLHLCRVFLIRLPS